MPTHFDWSSLTDAGLSLSCRLVPSAVQCRLPTALLPRPSPTAVSLSSFFQLLDWRSLPTSDHVEISSPKPLSGFALKQTKGSSAWRTTYIVSQGDRVTVSFLGSLDSSQYSGRSQQCCSFDGLGLSSDFHFFQSSSKTLETVPSVPITTGNTVVHMFHCFFHSLSRSNSLFIFSFIITVVVTVLFFNFYNYVISWIIIIIISRW